MLRDAPFTDVLNWISLNTPLTKHALDGLGAKDYGGVTLAYAGHIEPKMISHLEAFADRNVRLIVTPCVLGIAHAPSFEYLRERKIETAAEGASSWEELERAWDQILDRKPEYIFDIGGGLIKRAVERNVSIRAACEATSTGIDGVRSLEPKFPVFNWNDVPVKNLMHNRYEVGSGVWYGFRSLTGLDLCRLRVGVVGYGLVGQSVAASARGLGAQVWVAEQDALRSLTAASDGFATASLDHLVRHCDVVITATGVQRTITARTLAGAKDQLILANAGHDSRDLDLSGLGEAVGAIPGISSHAIDGGRRVFLLCEGRLLNLAAGGGSAVNTFDLVTALITNVVDYMLTTGAGTGPGLRDVPAFVYEGLVREAAESSLF